MRYQFISWLPNPPPDPASTERVSGIEQKKAATHIVSRGHAKCSYLTRFETCDTIALSLSSGAAA